MGTVVAFKPKAVKASPGAIKSANFTDAQIKAWLRHPPAARVEFKDDTDPKIRARVSKGRVALSLYAWNPATGKPKRWPLGNVTSVTAPETNMTTVRKEAGRLKVKIADKLDTAVEGMRVDYSDIRAKAAAANVSDLLAEYMANKKRAGLGLSDASRAIYERTVRSTLGASYTQPLAKLNPSKLLELCQARQATSAFAVRLTVAVMGAICNRHKLPDVTALVKDREEVTPTKGRPARMGVGSAQDAIVWAWHTAETEPTTYMGTGAAMLCVAMVMGWRRRTIKLMEWDWIDFKAGTIAIPADANKGRRDYLLPLPPRLLALLKTRRGKIGGALCFPAQRDQTQPAEFDQSFLARMPMKFSPHDVRKAFSLAMRKAKAPEDATKILMMHSTRRDVGLHNYLLTCDPAELMETLQETVAAVETLIASKVGDKGIRKRMEAAAYDREQNYLARARARPRIGRIKNRK